MVELSTLGGVIKTAYEAEADTNAFTDAEATDLAAATLNTDADVSGNTWVLDEDDLATDSATKLATQQSIKAYVDANAGGDLVDDTTPQLGGNLDLNGKQITGSGGTVTVSSPVLDLAQEWNDGAVAFTGIKLNVTDTASSSTSSLMELQKGGATQFIFAANGRIRKSYTGAAISFDVTSQLTVEIFPSIKSKFNANGFNVARDDYIGWSSSTNASSAPDVNLYRDAANTLALRNVTNAQAFNIYNTYTDASNYERLAIKWESNEVIVTPESSGTGTLNAVIFGVKTGSLINGAKFEYASGSGIKFYRNQSTPYINGTNLRFSLQSGVQLAWSSIPTDASSTNDVGIARVSAGIAKITNGSTGSGSLECGNLASSGGTVSMTNLPTSDPTVAGQLWNNSGVLQVSAG
jgi:hypothetical protein